jgi:choice-of-anchor B domain-containing protein
MQRRVLLLALVIFGTNLVFLASSSADQSPAQAPMEQQLEDFARQTSPSIEPARARAVAPCVDGMAAGIYPCDGIDLASHLSLADLGLSFANDIWGWTDPETRRDYALIGGIEGTVIVDVTDPKAPDIIGTLPSHSLEGNQAWRDIKVFSDHMFVVSEHTGHGLQVFDLTQVRGVTGDPVEFEETAHYPGFGNSHNLNINTETGFAYAVGSDTCMGGLHMVDINDPANPAGAGCFQDHGYIHDTQCVIYRGPDSEHRRREICLNSNAEPHHGDPTGLVNALSIVDVTDKANPIILSRTEYANDGYSHQGWLSTDHNYFLHGDELDEVDYGIGTTTRVWDVTDLDAPTVANVFENDTTSIDHNMYTEGKVVYQSNYTSGLRILDTQSLPDLSEIAYFDVYPEDDSPTFDGGTWSNYPYFRQKRIVAVSSMDRGLFVLRPQFRTGD